jgi:hypothetical protein
MPSLAHEIVALTWTDSDMSRPCRRLIGWAQSLRVNNMSNTRDGRVKLSAPHVEERNCNA